LTLVGEKNFEKKKKFMPIGTPKVPVIRLYRNSENKIFHKKVFITIREKFQEERILFLCRNIEYPLVNEFIALILLMDIEKESNIYLYINSEDGGPLSAMALYDTMQLSTSKICTMNIGSVGLAASLIMVGGAIPKRVAFPHADFIIHQPYIGYFYGRAKYMEIETEQILQFCKTIEEIFVQKTGQPLHVIQNYMKQVTFMSAEEAKDFGIIDYIAKTTKKSI